MENNAITPWQKIADVVSNYGHGKRRQLSLKVWLSELENLGADRIERAPAIKLIDFLSQSTIPQRLDLSDTMVVCSELAFGPVTEEQVTKYLDFQAGK